MTGRKRAVVPDGNDWTVAGDRPEERCEHPWEYWTPERITAVARASGQARIQHKLAMNAWMHLKARIDSGDCTDDATTILDVGCGLGFVADMLATDGRVVIGIDVIPAMIETGATRPAIREATRRGSYHVAVASAQALPLRPAAADIALSVSAMQWARQHDEIRGLGEELHRVLLDGGLLAIQFFPKSRAAMTTFGKTIGDAGFDGGIVVDNPENARKRRVYLVARKKEKS